MPKTWICSDQHFRHANILTFLRNDGTFLRSFASIKEHDECIIDNHNSMVAPEDKVYFLGDVAIPKKGLDLLPCLNGRKVLLRGNHDIHKLKHYADHFKDVRAYHKLDKIWLCHVPIHPNCLRFPNIHGHLHENIVMLPDGSKDERYYSVCMEHTNYTPVDFEAIRAHFATMNFIPTDKRKG